LFLEASAAPPAQFLPPKDTNNTKEPPVEIPDHQTWIAKDQTVLNYLLSNLGWEIITQVSSKVTDASDMLLLQ
jgi:hypothetical protein